MNRFYHPATGEVMNLHHVLDRFRRTSGRRFPWWFRFPESDKLTESRPDARQFILHPPWR